MHKYLTIYGNYAKSFENEEEALEFAKKMTTRWQDECFVFERTLTVKPKQKVDIIRD